MPIKDLPNGQEQDLWLDLEDPKEKAGSHNMQAGAQHNAVGMMLGHAMRSL